MTWKHAVFVAAVAGVAVPASAALPPDAQRNREFDAVMNSPAVEQALPPRLLIDKIERLADDLYRVTSGPCHVDALIVDLPTPGGGWAGPRRFNVVVKHKAVCREENG